MSIENRNAAVMEILPLAGQVAAQLTRSGKGADYEEAKSIASVAFLEAHDRYEPGKGEFDGFAYVCALNKVRDEMGLKNQTNEKGKPRSRREVMQDALRDEPIKAGSRETLLSVLSSPDPSPEDALALAQSEHLASRLDGQDRVLWEGVKEANGRVSYRDLAKRAGIDPGKVRERLIALHEALTGEPVPSPERQLPRLTGAQRSRRWWANLSAERKAEHLARRNARRKRQS
jgi:DNA-directed RNA polymerase specialized sigma24 family protein